MLHSLLFCHVCKWFCYMLYPIGCWCESWSIYKDKEREPNQLVLLCTRLADHTDKNSSENVNPACNNRIQPSGRGRGSNHMLNMVALQWSQPYVKLFCSVSQNSCTKCQRSYNGTGKRDVSAVDKSDGQKKVFDLRAYRKCSINSEESYTCSVYNQESCRRVTR